MPVPRFLLLRLPVCNGGLAAYDFFRRSLSAFSFSGSRSGGGPPPWPLGAWPMGVVRRAVRADYRGRFRPRCARWVPRRPSCRANGRRSLWRRPPRARCTDGLRLGTQFAPRSCRLSSVLQDASLAFEYHSSQETSHLSLEASRDTFTAQQRSLVGSTKRGISSSRRGALTAAEHSFTPPCDDLTRSLRS